ncbi:hypothetical protein SJ256_19810, partial [Citrobacter freundii]|nr:hypothetical protein [Citrobacter freundii]
ASTIFGVHYPLRNIRICQTVLRRRLRLRYAYSVDVMNYHMKRGFTKEEAQALTSMDLGHGDGRGHYVARVYNMVEGNE